MATTNLFTDPVFKDGAFTSNNAKIRAYALQKTMRAMDLGAEMGAKIYVFWGGREGVESDATKCPVEAVKRFREAIDFLCEYSASTRNTATNSPSRPSPMSRAGTCISPSPVRIWR
jgi:xylose isomerase